MLLRFSLILFGVLLLVSPAQAELPELLGIIESDTAVAWFGFRITPLGDQNGDGRGDLLVFSYKNGNDYFTGQNPIPSQSDLFFRYTNSFVDVIGDINGDGYDDIAIPGRAEYGWKYGVYYGGPLFDTLRDLTFGADTLSGFRNAGLGEDINGNGSNELICQAAAQRSIIFHELTQPFDSIPDFELVPHHLLPTQNFDSYGDVILYGDFNGDGKRDIALNWRPRTQDSLNGEFHMFWGSSNFDSVPDLVIRRPGEYSEHNEYFGQVATELGDFNVDGYEDIFVAPPASNDTLAFIFFGGPDIDTIPDITIPGKFEAARNAGDINHDGYPDLITGYPLPWSAAGEVRVYYGGPDADSIPDIVIKNSDVDGYQTELGNDVAGLGDFNGDGINDFAFSAVNVDTKGIVLIYSGFGPSTDAEVGEPHILPEMITLSQNYPNPFNPSTEIKFEMPRRSDVTIDVFNVLGRKVRQLVNGPFSVGSHRVEWDGTDDKGEQVASGIYFYRLKAGKKSLTKKMVLLK